MKERADAHVLSIGEVAEEGRSRVENQMERTDKKRLAEEE